MEPEQVERVATSLARLMSVLGFFFIASAGLGVMAMVVALVFGGPTGTVFVTLAGAVFVGLFAAAGVLLRAAADQIRRGATAGDDDTLALGFGSLRNYFILFAVVELLSLAWRFFPSGVL